MQKYVKTFVVNKWVTAAFALDPNVREIGLEKLLTEAYEGAMYLETTLAFINQRLEYHQERLGDRAPVDQDEVKWVKERGRVNKFASNRFSIGQQEPEHDTKDPWAYYNSGTPRFATLPNEPVLSYWLRMSREPELLPLALAAQDILGLASSSASVERVFSQSGYVLGKKRGSLSARMLAKQTSLRVWEQQGILSVDDL
jgi:hypothetical protein